MNSLDKRHVGDDFGLPSEILTFPIIMMFRKNETKHYLPSCTKHPWKTVETLCCNFCPLEYLTSVFMYVDVDSGDCTKEFAPFSPYATYTACKCTICNHFDIFITQGV